ncbi:uracil-DNA glycosylase [Leptothrix discophora]|uniref:Type-4 uracil-DNA glycosylase n=1 Tax=Leptothrix discophora TaxID=89 RepID=A0ABT9G744_LEPDI|nr:uracil-DNA glycosylase [Leptothrix discophora]MDP4302308.1 uracil-DNA glycosylase [Leptothrix discophora]
MVWSERQVAMLAEMGIHLRLPTTVAGPAGDAAVAALAAEPTAQSGEAVVPAVSTPVVATPAVAAPVVWVPEAARGASPIDPSSPVATMGWEALAEAVAGCRACELCDSRRNTVFGVGNRQARWMLIGEAPGENEDRTGQPFVGDAGQLLDNMLRATGLTRADGGGEEQVYIANVLKCRPPRNRNPEPHEVERCEPYLKRQVELVQPRLILALGRFAVQSILRSAEPIGRLRGKVHQYHGVPVVVTYHPGYLLRNPVDKSRVWEDLCLAREVMEGLAVG